MWHCFLLLCARLAFLRGSETGKPRALGLFDSELAHHTTNRRLIVFPFSSVVPKRFLVFSESNSLRFLSLEGSVEVLPRLTLPNSSVAVSVDYDARTQQVYWTDTASDTISVEGLQGDDRRQLVRGLTHPSGLAVDWVSHLLYFTDEESAVVGVARLDGRYVTTLIDNDLVSPRSIAVDPQNGLVVYYYY